MIRELVSERLRIEGYTVEEAENGERALTMLSSGTFDLLLTDLNMPALNGPQLLGKARENRNLATVIMSGKGDIETAVDAMKLGASDYIFKPVNFRILMHTIESLKNVFPIIMHHHERYDGKGYPSGLRGGTIPLEARVLAIADTCDATTSSRAYRSALLPERALAEKSNCSGSQFDPDLVRVFIDIHPRLELPPPASLFPSDLPYREVQVDQGKEQWNGCEGHERPRKYR